MTGVLKLAEDGPDLWLAEVRRCPSPNCDQRPVQCAIDLLVIHSISLPPGCYGNRHIDRLFTNCLDPAADPYFAGIHQLRVAAHLLIDRQGELTQYVPFNLRAWHAGESSFHGRADCNDFSIGIELEGCDDQAFEPAQYESLVAVTRVLMQRWPAIRRDRIVGHEDIAPGRKTDPGPGFDWEMYLTMLDAAPVP